MKEHFHKIVLEAIEETCILLDKQIEESKREIERIFNAETSR